MKIKNFKIIEFLLMLVVVLLAGVGGGLLLNNNYWYFGILALLVSFGLEYFLLTRIDSRDAMKDAKEEILGIVNGAAAIKTRMEEILTEIKQLKEEVFDPFSHDGFTSIEERINEIETALEMGTGFGRRFDKLSKMKEEIDNIKRNLGIR